jgi:hypothetical protein
MFKTLVIIAALLSTNLVSNDANADSQFTTVFHFFEIVGGHSQEIGVTPIDKHLIVPAAISNWECRITPAFLSPDGLEIYHNVVCLNVSTTLIIKSSVGCHVNKNDTNADSFMFIVNNIKIELGGVCATFSTSSTSDNNKI